MADDKSTAELLAEFLEFKAAKEAADAQDHDPDNERDVTIQHGETVLSIPWRKAKEYDIDGLLAGFGLKRKATPAKGGAGDGSSGDQGEGKTGGKPAGIRQLFPQAGGGKAASGT